MSDYEFFIQKYRYHEDGYLISNATNKQVGRLNEEGYVRIRGSNGKEYRAHRIIWSLFYGEIPEGCLIDHIDGNRSNNKIENLRLATREQNNVNRRKVGDNKLPKGVSKSGNMFRVRITSKGITYCLGSYSTVEEAQKAYETKAEELHGEFAYHMKK